MAPTQCHEWRQHPLLLLLPRWDALAPCCKSTEDDFSKLVPSACLCRLCSSCAARQARPQASHTPRASPTPTFEQHNSNLHKCPPSLRQHNPPLDLTCAHVPPTHIYFRVPHNKDWQTARKAVDSAAPVSLTARNSASPARLQCQQLQQLPSSNPRGKRLLRIIQQSTPTHSSEFTYGTKGFPNASCTSLCHSPIAALYPFVPYSCCSQDIPSAGVQLLRKCR